MLILTEGVDKSGKSSLINELSRIFKYPVIKNPYKPTEYSKEFIAGFYAGLYKGLLSCYAPSEHFILDRSHITEIVYGRVVRSYNALEVFDWVKYEKDNLLDKAVIIYMSASQETIYERCEREKEEYLNFDLIEDITNTYFDYLNQVSSLPSLHLSSENTMNHNIIHSLKFLEQYGYLRN